MYAAFLPFFGATTFFVPLLPKTIMLVCLHYLFTYGYLEEYLIGGLPVLAGSLVRGSEST